MIETEASVKGRVLADLLSHLTNDLQIGKKIKSGELRKRLKEPPWIVPDCFNMTHIELKNFSMKLLSLKENPSQDHVILQLHGGGYMGAVRNAYYVFAGLYNEVSHGCNVLTPEVRLLFCLFFKCDIFLIKGIFSYHFFSPSPPFGMLSIPLV